MQRPTLAILALVSFYALFICTYALISRRDSRSIFFDAKTAYSPRYSAYRTEQAQDFIVNYKEAAAHKPKWSPVHEASLCVGLISPPSAAQTLPITIGSLLEGMDDAERERLHLKVFVPHTEPETHSALNEPWLHSLVDSTVLYSQTHSPEQIDSLRVLETGTAEDRETKRTRDFFSLMRHCLAIGSPYVLMLEGGVLAADGWLQRTLAALEDVEHHIDSPFDLRLFNAESSFDQPAGHSWSTYAIWSGLLVALIFALVRLRQVRGGNVKNITSSSSSYWMILLAIPALVILFLVGQRLATLPPKEGIVEMDRYNGRAQALAFSRRHATDMVDWAGDSRDGNLEDLIETYAAEKGYMRFGVLPSLFQHLGANSSTEYSGEWSFAFETLKPEELLKEHRRFHSHGLIKHVGL